MVQRAFFIIHVLKESNLKKYKNKGESKRYHFKTTGNYNLAKEHQLMTVNLVESVCFSH